MRQEACLSFLWGRGRGSGRWGGVVHVTHSRAHARQPDALASHGSPWGVSIAAPHSRVRAPYVGQGGEGGAHDLCMSRGELAHGLASCAQHSAAVGGDGLESRTTGGWLPRFTVLGCLQQLKGGALHNGCNFVRSV